MRKTIYYWSGLLILVLLLSCNREKITYETTWLKLGLSGKGYVTSIFDKIKSVEYFPDRQAVSLLTLYQILAARAASQPQPPRQSEDAT